MKRLRYVYDLLSDDLLEVQDICMFVYSAVKVIRRLHDHDDIKFSVAHYNLLTVFSLFTTCSIIFEINLPVFLRYSVKTTCKGVTYIIGFIGREDISMPTCTCQCAIKSAL